MISAQYPSICCMFFLFFFHFLRGTPPPPDPLDPLCLGPPSAGHNSAKPPARDPCPGPLLRWNPPASIFAIFLSFSLSAGVSHDSPRAQTCTVEGPGASKTPTKFHKKTPRERKSGNGGERGKKKRDFFAPAFGPPPFEPPRCGARLFGPPPFRPQPLGP